MLESLERIVANEEIDLAIANCENSAAGFGTTPKIADLLLEAGIHVLTSGNHIWDKKEILSYLDRQPRLLRPANYPDAPGSGMFVGQTDAAVPYAVFNLQGRVYMPGTDCPFRCIDQLLSEVPPEVVVRFVRLPCRNHEREDSVRHVRGRTGERRCRHATRTCRPRTSDCCREAQDTSPTWA